MSVRRSSAIRLAPLLAADAARVEAEAKARARATKSAATAAESRPPLLAPQLPQLPQLPLTLYSTTERRPRDTPRRPPLVPWSVRVLALVALLVAAAALVAGARRHGATARHGVYRVAKADEHGDSVHGGDGGLPM